METREELGRARSENAGEESGTQGVHADGPGIKAAGAEATGPERVGPERVGAEATSPERVGTEAAGVEGPGIQAGEAEASGLDGAGPGPEPRLYAALMAALKAVGFYPPGNPVRDRLVGALLREIRSAPGEVAVAFRQDELLVAGLRVAGRGDEGWDIPVRLFEAGMRDLTFLPQATAAELQSLLDLLARTVRGELNPTDEDLSVLLWEMDLPSIAYRVIDAAEESAPLSEIDDQTPPGGASDDPAAWEGIHPLERYLASAGGLEETDLDLGALRAEETELARLRSQAKQEAHQMRPKLVMVLLELILVGLTPTEFERVIALLRGYALDLLQVGRFAFFGRVMTRLRERAEELRGQEAQALTGLVGELSGAEAATRVLAALDAQRCDDERAATTFLAELSPAGLRVLLDALAADLEHDPGEVRWRVAGAALRSAAASSPERVVGDPAKLTEHHLRVLARLIPPGQAPERARFWSQSLSPLWTSGDPGVRAGALRLLAAVRPPDLERLLQLALNDEDSSVRQTAAELYGAVFGARALQPLLHLLLSHGFEQRSFEEQAAFYEALTRASPEEVFPLLEKTVRRRDWLARKHWRVQKACALRALGSVPIEKAGSHLMRYRNARDPLLAEASRYALECHRRKLQAPAAAARRAA
jgi:HEAT repeat protein